MHLMVHYSDETDWTTFIKKPTTAGKAEQAVNIVNLWYVPSFFSSSTIIKPSFLCTYDKLPCKLALTCATILRDQCDLNDTFDCNSIALFTLKEFHCAHPVYFHE